MLSYCFEASFDCPYDMVGPQRWMHNKKFKSTITTIYCKFSMDYEIFFESSSQELGMLKRERSERLTS